tara:strand:+ start:420 stop:695 length:276 start_codon:yes stop_codon:yes gene_type:complete
MYKINKIFRNNILFGGSVNEFKEEIKNFTAVLLCIACIIFLIIAIKQTISYNEAEKKDDIEAMKKNEHYATYIAATVGTCCFAILVFISGD